MTPAAEVWASFSHDPRLGANAALRATDGDRDVVHQVLADAYADGRLDREEFDTRTAQTAAARTLGELPPLLADLVAPTPVPSGGVPPASAAVLRQRAVAKYRADRRDAFLGFLAPSFICMVIWFAFGASHFFWPGFVIAGTGINVLSMLIRRENIIEENTRRLEKKQAKDQAARELQSRPPEDKDDSTDEDGTTG
jgi:hypothetical protein